MSTPIRPEQPFIPQKGSNPDSKATQTALTKATQEILNKQRARLQSTAPESSREQINTLLGQNKKELLSALDNNPNTKNLSESVKQDFVSSKIAEQTQSFLNPIQTKMSRAFRNLANIKQEIITTSPLQSSGKIGATEGTTPVSEDVIKVNGVSCVLIYPPGVTDPSKAMLFPISQTAAQGQEGGPDYSSSEALWYTMQNAYNAGDETTFQQTANAYLYLVNQKQATINAGDQSNYANQWAPTYGLMGWTFDLGMNPPGSNLINNIEKGQDVFPYAQGNVSDPGLSSATDADEQIINMLIKGNERWPGMQLNCAGTYPSPNTNCPTGDPSPMTLKNSMPLQDLLNQACDAFMSYDISNPNTPPSNGTRIGFTYDGVTYQPVLTDDNWGKNILNPSYADFQALANIYHYAQSQPKGTFSSWNDPKNIITAVQNTFKYLVALQKDYQGGLPDNPNWSEVNGKPTPVGWDSIRFLTSAAMYIYSCKNMGNDDPFGILSENQTPNLMTMTQQMLQYVWSVGTNTGQPNMTLSNGSTLSGPALLGPMLVAAKVLALNDLLPSNMTTSDIQTLSDSLDASMASTYNPSNTDPTEWQKAYYATELYLVNRYDADQLPNPS